MVEKNKKYKVLILSDDPRGNSGIAVQTRYIVEHLAKSKNFDVVVIGSNLALPDQLSKPVVTEAGYKLYSFKTYGNIFVIRDLLEIEKPDIIWFFTDPRRWEWLWHMEDEVRDKIPYFYYYIWDNYPVPYYNKSYYDSCDHIACGSKLTYDLTCEVVKKSDKISYIPLAFNINEFHPLERKEIIEDRKRFFKLHNEEDRFFIFYNNVNIFRKLPADIICIFKEFVEDCPNSALVMHTDPDKFQDLETIKKDILGGDDRIIFTRAHKMLPTGELNKLYNIADVSINISSNEGFGLSVGESLAAGVPVISCSTGGMREQCMDKNGNHFGKCIFPEAYSMAGSQPTPYIIDDRILWKDVVRALKDFYNMTWEERKKIGLSGREHIIKNYNYKNTCRKMEEMILKTIKEFKPRERIYINKI